MQTTASPLKDKSHFEVLDGLRGVAAIMVVCFHTLEANNGGSRFRQIINHGYLAVDFFFLLSGFVIAYAYDDRWTRMSSWDFYKRRLIRLQPMVIMGSLIGAALFSFGKGALFPLIGSTPSWKVLLVMLVGFTLLPLPVSMDIRGWQEMHPLNGPAWSLFFEYLANIAYALGLRKASLRVLSLLALLAAVFLGQYLLFGPQGDAIGGWSLTAQQLHIGFARLCFPFLAGMLLMRSGWRLPVRGAFLWCSLLLIVAFSLPRFGGTQHLWQNGLYELICIVVVFPVVVAMGAGALTGPTRSDQLCRALGGLSYPLYITHYPLIYVYTAWVVDNHVPMRNALLPGLALVLLAITIGWLSLKFYDEPVRLWLSRRFLDTNRPV